MFCPKCGTKNPDDGKFCRSCGVDLGNVSAAMSGKLTAKSDDWGWSDLSGSAETSLDAKRRKDPNEVYGDSIKNIISGLGFLIVAIVLLVTGVVGGKAWWWAMLFPAFAFFSKGVSDYFKYRKMDAGRAVGFSTSSAAELNQRDANAGLPPPQTEFIPAQPSRYQTGDLVPPSVTDNTTRHLEVNSEGETMTLPKK